MLRKKIIQNMRNGTLSFDMHFYFVSVDLFEELVSILESVSLEIEILYTHNDDK